MNNAKQLIEDIKSEIASWNEMKPFVLKGVGNLSRADLDMIKMYAEQYIDNGGSGFTGLMDPLGGTKKVLEAYDLHESQMGLFF